MLLFIIKLSLFTNTWYIHSYSLLITHYNSLLYICSQGLTDCTCCICKSFNQENGNKLMECHTCQNLYHQECHEPVITDQEVADPRLIWNCSKCVKPIAQSVRMHNVIKNCKWLRVRRLFGVWTWLEIEPALLWAMLDYFVFI